MCKEDLGLGRGRYTQPPIVAIATTDNLMAPDATRVALIVSFQGFSYFDSAAVASVHDYAQLFIGPRAVGNPSIMMVQGCGPIVLRIEDFGELITGSFSVSILNQTGGAGVSLQPICSSVRQPPITE